MFTWIFHCDPVLSWIGTAYMTCTCHAKLQKNAEYWCGSINIVTDVIIWLLPLPMVWKITQSMRERVFAILTFGIGALACIACGIRLNTVKHIWNSSGSPPNAGSYNLWTMVELYLAIICSSVPALRALILKKAPSILGSSKQSTGTSESGEKAAGAVKYDDEKSGPGVLARSEASYSDNRTESPV